MNGYFIKFLLKSSYIFAPKRKYYSFIVIIITENNNHTLLICVLSLHIYGMVWYGVVAIYIDLNWCSMYVTAHTSHRTHKTLQNQILFQFTHRCSKRILCNITWNLMVFVDIFIFPHLMKLNHIDCKHITADAKLSSVFVLFKLRRTFWRTE